MKRYGNLFEKIVDFENLYYGYRKASLGHRENVEVLEYMLCYEARLFEIQKELIDKTYHTGQYKSFFVYEPKKRLIMALPFRDRIVHHALCNIIEPIFEAGFISDSYACRTGKGSHRGLKKVEHFINALGKDCYVLKCDVRKYFYTIDHAVLKQIIRRKIKCKDTLWLIDNIIDSNHIETGIPIGNLTSQLFANIYLNELDHYVKEDLGIKNYIRYMDDIVVLRQDKKELWGIYHNINNYIKDILKLEFNNKTKLFSLKQGIDFLGFRQFFGFRLLRKHSIIKNKRKFRKFTELYKSNRITFDRINQSIQSFIGHAQWGNTWRIRENILRNLVLVGGGNV